MKQQEIRALYRKSIESLPIGITLELSPALSNIGPVRIMFLAEEAGYSYTYQAYWSKHWEYAMDADERHRLYYKTLRNCKLALLRKLGWDDARPPARRGARL
jgi:hypothetical protein